MLETWPAVNPTQGHKTLPKREGVVQLTRTSFRADLLGPWKADSAQVEPAIPPSPSAAAEPPEGFEEAASSTQVQEPWRGQHGDRVEPPPRAAAAEPLKHTWKWQTGRWICTSCLATSRTSVPRQIFRCPGLSPSIRDLLNRPRGHKLQIATFTSGAGLVVICSGCGRFTTSNRRGVLHNEPCPSEGRAQAVFQSDGARFSYKRVCEGKHPSYKQGSSKVLDPCISAEMLARLASQQEDFPT